MGAWRPCLGGCHAPFLRQGQARTPSSTTLSLCTLSHKLYPPWPLVPWPAIVDGPLSFYSGEGEEAKEDKI